MRRAAALALLLAATARADGPGTRIGVMVGRSEPTGSLGNRYNLGWTLGFEAGWMPTWAGFVWAVTWNVYSASTPTDPVQTFSLLDFSFAFRGQALVRRTGLPIAVYGQIGPSLLRSSTALGSDESTSFFGPKLGVGIEARWPSFFLGVQADYGLLGGGPSQLQIMLRFGAGMF